jgi:radical SAM-linked protein
MRVRLRFCKTGKIRWTSHRDVARMWERAFRRVELPITYTRGYSPRPRVSFGLALPTGHESLAEYLDVELDPGRLSPGFDVAAQPAQLTPALPVGIEVTAAAGVADRADSLQHEVTSCRWEVEVVAVSEDRLRAMVAGALAAPSLVISRERKGQPITDDVRPAIVAAAVLGATPAGALLECELATQPRGLRPSELLRALDPSLEHGRVCRTHQWISCDGARREPLPLAATERTSAPQGAPHARLLERAS